nr:phage tail domain-containing protein [Cryobacterium sp. TMT2-15-1]
MDGLEMPAIRSSRGSRSGQAGGYFGAQLYDVRRITLNGRIFSTDIAEAKAKRRAIQQALPLFPMPVTMRYVDDDGQVYLIYCQVMDFKMPIARFQGKSIFKIELEASDPVIYDDTAGSALSATILQALPGGVQFTDTTPLFDSFYFSAGQTDVTVTNTSGIASFPIITIPGAINNPVFTNRTTGESFRLAGYSVGADAVTIINMGERTVTLNGGNAFAYAPSDVNWWALVPGNNRIEFSSGGGSDGTQATMTWRPGYWGI